MPADSEKSRVTACETCGEQRKVMKRCTRCRNTLYCSRNCQIKDWQLHSRKCTPPVTEKSYKIINEIAQQSESQLQRDLTGLPKTIINIKCNHKKHSVTLYGVDSSSGKSLMELISKHLRIPIQSLKIIAEGKLLDDGNIKEMILGKKCRNFQAFGEEAEDEDGLDAGDIEAIMDELHVSRNKAIKSLRSCNGDLIDAILELGNKL